MPNSFLTNPLKLCAVFFGILGVYTPNSHGSITPYIGIQGGIQGSHHDAYIRDKVDAAGTDFFDTALNKVTGAFGLVSGFYYEFPQKWTVGAEIDGLIGENKPDFSQGTTVGGTRPVFTSVERSSVFGAAARFGYKVGDVAHPYIRLGTDYSHYAIKFQGSDVGTAAIIDGTRHLNSIAFVGGTGVDLKIADHVSVGGEYRLSYGASKTMTLQAPNGAKGIVTLKPRFHTALLSLRWFW